MATVTYIKEVRQAVSAMKGVMFYCLQDKKVTDGATGQRMVSSIHCDGENVFVEFMATKQAGFAAVYHAVEVLAVLGSGGRQVLVDVALHIFPGRVLADELLVVADNEKLNLPHKSEEKRSINM